ncbi:MAG: hypothetical protein ACI9ON_001609 [Limisphaerales bacterium]|jgi:hypothetical protein
MPNCESTIKHLCVWTVLVLLASCSKVATATEPGSPTYQTTFTATFSSSKPFAEVAIHLTQDSAVALEFDFDAPSGSYKLLSADGNVVETDQRIRWNPPATGGVFRYSFAINEHAKDRQDSKHTNTWAILRLGDLFPRAKVRTLKGASNTTKVELRGPHTWSFESGYGSLKQPKMLPAGERAFNRPEGWLIAGELGTRRDIISGIKVAVSAPTGTAYRRMDTLVFLRLVLPELQKLIPTLPERLLIVGAPSSMWRGGLSAPGSLYIHNERPLVSENSTSTLLHELVHISGVHSAETGSDWLVEGLAEYIGLLALQRAGGISLERMNGTLEKLGQWVAKDGGKLTDPSKGADTAAAVLILHQLHQELAAQDIAFQTLLTALSKKSEYSKAALSRSMQHLLGYPSEVLDAL